MKIKLTSADMEKMLKKPLVAKEYMLMGLKMEVEISATLEALNIIEEGLIARRRKVNEDKRKRGPKKQ